MRCFHEQRKIVATEELMAILLRLAQYPVNTAQPATNLSQRLRQD
jgi:hypothetical protein